MRVRQGWSGEVSPGVWGKFDVELEEEDLRRLLMADERYHPGVDPSISHAFRIVEIEAEMLVTQKLITRYGFDAPAGIKKLEELRDIRDAMIDKVFEAAKDVRADA